MAKRRRKTTKKTKPESIRYTEAHALTPNHSGGINQKLGVVLHHTGGTYTGAVGWLTNRQARASAHVIIAQDGRRTLLVPGRRPGQSSDDTVMWHAGVSQWRGRNGCNAFTLGVEFAGDTNQEPLTEAQVQSFLQWFLPRAWQYGWTVDDVTDHRTIAPGRKVDLHPDELARVKAQVQQALALPA
jgi:AmpD protein